MLKKRYSKTLYKHSEQKITFWFYYKPRQVIRPNENKEDRKSYGWHCGQINSSLSFSVRPTHSSCAHVLHDAQDRISAT